MDKWNLLLLSLFIAVTAIAASEYCEQKGACECEFSDGTQINLAGLIRNDKNDGNIYLNYTKVNSTVFYHGCTDVEFNLTIDHINQDRCRHPAVICVFDNKTKNIETLAFATSGKFAVDEHNLHTLSYENSGISTTVQLICTPDYAVNKFEINDVSKDGKQYKLQLFSQRACRTALPHVLSTGTKLLIMFFTFLLVYFIGGALLAFFVRGARGRELIPNVDFWTNLPGLVKDGTVFLLSGCSTRLVTTAETYDQI